MLNSKLEDKIAEIIQCSNQNEECTIVHPFHLRRKSTKKARMNLLRMLGFRTTKIQAQTISNHRVSDWPYEYTKMLAPLATLRGTQRL